MGIIAFPFEDVGQKTLGRITSEKAREFKIPVFAHENIRLEPDITKVTYFNEELGNPSTTLRMVRPAIQWVKLNKIRWVWLVAGKPHLSRCKRDLEYEARDVEVQIGKVRICTEIEMYSYRSWFHSTKHMMRWSVREQIIRQLPWPVYKMVAK